MQQSLIISYELLEKFIKIWIVIWELTLARQVQGLW